MSSFFRRKRATIPPPADAPAPPDPLAGFFQEAERGFRQREEELAREATETAAREAARRVRALYVIEPATEDEWIRDGMVELVPKDAVREQPIPPDEDGEVTDPGFRLAGATP